MSLAKVEKQDSAQPVSAGKEQMHAERPVGGPLREAGEPHRIAENVPVRQLTRDFDIS